MRILTWAAVAVTALFALMNLGAALGSGESGAGLRLLGAVLFVAGAAAAAGLATRRTWGRTAVIGVGAVNVATAAVGLAFDPAAAVVGLVVGGLGVVLGVLAREPVDQAVAA
jgi:hypothetical protein